MSEQVKEISQWIINGDHDLGTAKITYFHIPEYLDTVTFHCQQAVEKYLKAYLIFCNVDFGKTHNLEYLLELCGKQDKTFHTVNVGNLSFYAVEVRYPDDFYIPTNKEAKESIKISKVVKTFVIDRINN